MLLGSSVWNLEHLPDTVIAIDMQNQLGILETDLVSSLMRWIESVSLSYRQLRCRPSAALALRWWLRGGGAKDPLTRQTIFELALLYRFVLL